MADLSSPLQGIQKASADFNRAAVGIARATIPASTTEYPSDTVDLCREIVALIQAKNDFAANTKPLRIADEMNRNILDMIG